jgi:hypothetical protein
VEHSALGARDLGEGRKSEASTSLPMASEVRAILAANACSTRVNRTVLLRSEEYLSSCLPKT